MNLLALALGAATIGAQESPAPPPNIVLVFTDDQGYGDLGCYGHPTIATPHLDRLAAEGVRLTQFYTASSVCSPSRAALLTGCYPVRVGMHNHVVFPMNDFGLHPDEETLAELLRERGYRTGCFGKWHLGHREGLLPTDQGFDRFSGVPYSNDMAQFHRKPGAKYDLRLPWMEGDEVVEWEPDQHLLTKRQTDAAIEFIDAALGADERAPFFAYVPYSMPHIPIYASEDHAGTSLRGDYGDVIEEIDASVGRIVAKVREHGAERETLVLFASDNGPWLPFRERGGSAGPLRGGKGTTFEGGHRVPFVAWWPGTLPAGRTAHGMVTALDIVPTLARITGARAPRRTIDGVDRWGVLDGSGAAEAASFLYYEPHGKLEAIRSGPWKLLLEKGELYHLEHDISEAYDKAKKNPEVVAALREEAAAMHARLIEGARPRGTGERALFDPRRPAGDGR